MHVRGRFFVVLLLCFSLFLLHFTPSPVAAIEALEPGVEITEPKPPGPQPPGPQVPTLTFTSDNGEVTVNNPLVFTLGQEEEFTVTVRASVEGDITLNLPQGFNAGFTFKMNQGQGTITVAYDGSLPQFPIGEPVPFSISATVADQAQSVALVGALLLRVDPDHDAPTLTFTENGNPVTANDPLVFTLGQEEEFTVTVTAPVEGDITLNLLPGFNADGFTFLLTGGEIAVAYNGSPSQFSIGEPVPFSISATVADQAQPVTLEGDLWLRVDPDPDAPTLTFTENGNTVTKDNPLVFTLGQVKEYEVTVGSLEEGEVQVTTDFSRYNGDGFTFTANQQQGTITVKYDGSLIEIGRCGFFIHATVDGVLATPADLRIRVDGVATSIDNGGDTGGGASDSDPGKTSETIDGDEVASISTSDNKVTITWKNNTKTTYNLNQFNLTFTYDEKSFSVAQGANGGIVVTGDGELFPDGTIVVLTATETGTTQATNSRAALRKGASYALGEVKATVKDGKSVFMPSAEQIAKLPAAGTFDLTFATKSGANPAFKGTFAKGYVHVKDEPAGPEILLDASETASGGGVQVSATVISGDVPQARVTVQFTLKNQGNTHVTSISRTTDAAGSVPAFTLDTGLTNGSYTVTAAATGYAPVSKTVTVTKGEASGGDEGEQETSDSSSGGGCDAGFGIMALLALGMVVKRRR